MNGSDHKLPNGNGGKGNVGREGMWVLALARR